MKKKAVSGGRRAYILTMRILMGAAAIITAALVLFLIAYVLIKGLPNVSWALLSTAPSYLSDRIGILPDILNTLYIVIATLLIVLPRGMALAVLLLIGYCYLHRWDYNALLSGEETALSLGIHVRRLTLTNVVLTCFVCSVIVSHVGLTNFIGLVAPHIVRMVVGNNYIYLIPGSVLAGAALLLLSDLAARVIIMPVILPIGALTAFLGGPLFLYLLFKGRGRT